MSEHETILELTAKLTNKACVVVAFSKNDIPTLYDLGYLSEPYPELTDAEEILLLEKVKDQITDRMLDLIVEAHDEIIESRIK